MSVCGLAFYSESAYCLLRVQSLCVTVVVLPWRVRTPLWLRGCAITECVLVGTMVIRAMHVLATPVTVRARRGLTESKVVCAHRTFVYP